MIVSPKSFASRLFGSALLALAPIGAGHAEIRSDDDVKVEAIHYYQCVLDGGIIEQPLPEDAADFRICHQVSGGYIWCLGDFSICHFFPEGWFPDPNEFPGPGGRHTAGDPSSGTIAPQGDRPSGAAFSGSLQLQLQD